MEKSQRKKAVLLMSANTAAFLFMVIVNFLANYLPLNNTPTEEISDMYYNIFTPAGFTFIIWGVIYLLLTILVIYLIKGLKDNNQQAVQAVLKMRWCFIVSSLFNGSWLFAWHYDRIGISLILMLGLLASLIKLYLNLRNLSFAPGFYLLPISVYLGWITVATVANIAVFSVSVDWGRWGLSAEFWFTVLLLLVLAVAAVVVLKKRDTAYGLVILWALIGIFSARAGDQPGWNYATYAALTAAVVMALILIQKIRSGLKRDTAQV